MAEELKAVRAAIQQELELARAGEGYEEAAVADGLVELFIAPLLWLHAESAHEKGVAYGLMETVNLAALSAVDEARAQVADVHMLRDRAESSRRAWAEEAIRLDTIIQTQIGRFEAQALKAEAKIDEHPDALTAEACWRNAAKWLKKAVAVSVFPEETP